MKATTKTTYYYGTRDFMGQYTGYVYSVELSDSEITERNGLKYYGSHFLFNSENEAIYHCNM